MGYERSLRRWERPNGEIELLNGPMAAMPSGPRSPFQYGTQPDRIRSGASGGPAGADTATDDDHNRVQANATPSTARPPRRVPVTDSARLTALDEDVGTMSTHSTAGVPVGSRRVGAAGPAT